MCLPANTNYFTGCGGESITIAETPSGFARLGVRLGGIGQVAFLGQLQLRELAASCLALADKFNADRAATQNHDYGDETP